VQLGALPGDLSESLGALLGELDKSGLKPNLSSSSLLSSESYSVASEIGQS
jgi:hypothetical protein